VSYGNDQSVYVEDKKGDLGAPGSSPFWLSPDVDIPAHSGQAVQGSNDVQIRVHAHEEPILQELIVAEVYVGTPSLVLSPTTGTKRIDPGTLRFRPLNFPGTEPIADEPGGTLSFSWTPSASASDPDGPGHRCLVLRAFPISVPPPTAPFDVPNERHEAQHNIEILTTTTTAQQMSSGGDGTPKHPRGRDKATGLWWEVFSTVAAKARGKHYVVWAFDPEPSDDVIGSVRNSLKKAGFAGFSDQPPGKVTVEALKTRGKPIDPRQLLKDPQFAAQSGLGKGLFAESRLLGAATLDLRPDRVSRLVLRFDLSNLAKRTAVVLHGVQWNEAGEAEGGMTVVALAPTDP
jgi:hypothetical protein